MAFNNLYNQETRLLNLYFFNVAFAMTSICMLIIEYFKSKESVWFICNSYEAFWDVCILVCISCVSGSILCS